MFERIVAHFLSAGNSFSLFFPEESQYPDDPVTITRIAQKIPSPAARIRRAPPAPRIRGPEIATAFYSFPSFIYSCSLPFGQVARLSYCNVMLVMCDEPQVTVVLSEALRLLPVVANAPLGQLMPIPLL